MPERASAVRLRHDAARIVLAFDFGLKRIGIAAGDTLTRTAAPRGRRRRRSRAVPTGSAIAREVRALAPAVLVVGAPYNADGSEGALAASARAFAAELERRFALPVQLVDERFSSLEADARAQGAARERRSAAGASAEATSTAPPPR